MQRNHDKDTCINKTISFHKIRYLFVTTKDETSKVNSHLEYYNSKGNALMSSFFFQIVDLETGKPLGPNQRGELCVKGSTLFEGYIGKKQELDEDGFYRTGDIAYYDKEGFFYIVDRLKELIKYNAWQVRGHLYLVIIKLLKTRLISPRKFI